MENEADSYKKLKEQVAKINSGAFTNELRREAKGVVNGGLIFGGIGIVYAMLSNKNTFIFGIAGFISGIIMASVYKKIEKINV